MVTVGTPLSQSSTRALLLGSGELGKELAIELQRFGIEVIAVDRYPDAPAMQVSHRSHVINMLDEDQLEYVISTEKPDVVIPEIEAIATDLLVKIEASGTQVIPTARAARLTMNREGIRRLAAEELDIPTSRFNFANSREAFTQAVADIGIPCVVKPIMSSSGKGQSTIQGAADIDEAWDYAQRGSRGRAESVIVEGFVEFDYEITLLTVRHVGGTSFCEPIGHVQVNGDYRESWQPHQMTQVAKEKSLKIARKVTSALGGWGIFGVELFVQGDEVLFSEVSPRPHDTGMVTLISQDLSEFALHARAVLGLPIPAIKQYGPAASNVILVAGHSSQVRYNGIDNALSEPDTQLRLFGKPEVQGTRRMGVALALANDIESARAKAKRVADSIDVAHTIFATDSEVQRI